MIQRMLRIRLQRVGRKHDPHFRVVLTDQKNGPKSGRFLDVLGSYDAKAGNVQLKGDKIKEWIAKGAQVSDTVHNMLVSKKIIEGKKINVLPKKTPVVKEMTEEEKAAAEAPAESAETEKPAEEAPAETEATEEKPAEPAAEAVEEKPVEETKEEIQAEPAEVASEDPAQISDSDESVSTGTGKPVVEEEKKDPVKTDDSKESTSNGTGEAPEKEKKEE